MNNIDELPHKVVFTRSSKLTTMVAYNLAIAIGLTALIVAFSHIRTRRLAPIDSKLILPIALLVFIVLSIISIQSIINRIEIDKDEVCLFYLVPTGFCKCFALNNVEVDYKRRVNAKGSGYNSLQLFDRTTGRKAFDIIPGMSGFSEEQLKEIKRLLNEQMAAH